jgi:hypothetical protein
MLRLLARLQGWFYVLTGLWSLIDLDSFQAVTGPKTDLWLVRTVGVLVLVVGGVLLVAAARRRVGAELVMLAVGCALGLAGIDVVYTANGTIAPVYLLDAAAELGLVVLWAIAWRRRERE